MIKRKIIPFIEKKLFKGKAVIVYGARQVGKTTLVKEIGANFGEYLYLNCDEPDTRDSLQNRTSTYLKSYIGNKKLVLIDEAQRVSDIGLTLKLLVDNFPEIQVIATGSSSFELADSVNEPLTGRKYEFHLYPLSLQELLSVYSLIEIDRLLEQFLVYGLYPEVVTKSDEKANILSEITKSYLYKDILSFGNIKNSHALENLIKALALQIGSEVSYTEIANLIGVDKKTVENYINILEKAFIVFRLNPYSTNPRNELKRMRKVYFYDNGLRNSVIKNLNGFDIRNDIGALWENFLVTERIKFNSNNFFDKDLYFWRNFQKREVDLIEDYGGELNVFEFKWTAKKIKIPADFTAHYQFKSFEQISRDNYHNFAGLI